MTILYFGDFDPSGEDMVRSLRERLTFFGSRPEILKCALVAEDVNQYDLPSDFTKQTDTRSHAFVAKYGDLAVELDALPVDALRERLVTEIENRIDIDALNEVKTLEQRERDRLIELMSQTDERSE